MTSSATAARTSLEHVVVLGANGTMGFGSAVLFTNSVPRVTFLARSTEKAEAGLQSAIKQVRSWTVANRAEVGNYDDDLVESLRTADLIFEAVAESMELKKDIFDRIEAARHPDSIVATVSSSLSINALAAGRSESFRRHFCGLHFFNPTNVIVGTELIGCSDTDPAMLDFLDDYCTKNLGRVMIRAKDTPAFAGNRVGFKVLNKAAQLAEHTSPLVLDLVIGPYTGRALSPLATIDLVGWDVHRAIVDNVYHQTDDESHESLRLPDYMAELIDRGILGNKSGSGFYRRDGKTKLVLDVASGEYVHPSEIEMPDLSYIDGVAKSYSEGRYHEGLEALLAADSPEALLTKRVMAGYISYSFNRVGEVCESITDIDRIMGYGFNWAPPSVLVDFLGVDDALAMLAEAGVPIPVALEEAAANPDAPPFSQNLSNPGRYFVAA